MTWEKKNILFNSTEGRKGDAHWLKEKRKSPSLSRKALGERPRSWMERGGEKKKPPGRFLLELRRNLL